MPARAKIHQVNAGAHRGWKGLSDTSSRASHVLTSSRPHVLMSSRGLSDTSSHPTYSSSSRSCSSCPHVLTSSRPHAPHHPHARTPHVLTLLTFTLLTFSRPHVLTFSRSRSSCPHVHTPHVLTFLTSSRSSRSRSFFKYIHLFRPFFPAEDSYQRSSSLRFLEPRIKESMFP